MPKTKKKNQEPNLNVFFEFMEEVSANKNLSREKLLDILKESFLVSHQYKYGLHADLKVVIDSKEKDIYVLHNRKVAERSSVSNGEIGIEEARKKKADVQLDDIIEERYEPLSFSRSMATKIRQTLVQRLRELEKEVIYDEFKEKEGDLINGYFLRWRDREIVYIDIGRTEAILPRREQIPEERFRPGDRVKALIKTVELRREKTREPGPYIILSRASPYFVQKLFEIEIPEIYDGVVEIIDIVRQAGYRTKLLVRSMRQDIDPVGACVGIKGVRIQAIVRELGNERIDIVNYAQTPENLISNALSPAEVLEVRLDADVKEAFVVVSDSSYSVAIGNTGHNVRLACQLTGYNIVVKSQSQFEERATTPEAKEQIDMLFGGEKEEKQKREEVAYTPLSDLPDMSSRIIKLLNDNGLKSVEELIETSEENLAGFSGIGKTTAKQIRKILSETVEFEEL